MQVDFTKGTAIAVIRANSMIAGGTAKNILHSELRLRPFASLNILFRSVCGYSFTHVNI